MTRIVGVDTLSPVSEATLAKSSTEMLQSPVFWGRYFTSRHTGGTGEYHHLTEDPLLAQHQIRVLPIARQTNKVSLGHSEGLSDGRDNADDLISTFGETHLVESGAEFRIFLDVEGNGASHLSVEYYRGWCEGLKVSEHVKILPCVYGIPGDLVTWNAVKAAIKRGAECHGVWLSHPYFGANKPEEVNWNASMLRPYPGIDDVPILLWQYIFCGTYDRNMVNPAFADASDFLRTLPLPRSTQ